MLRITVHEEPASLTFQLEGSLAARWLKPLVECWHRTLAERRKSTLRVDLSGVTCIDGAGKACLETMHYHGAEFIAPDCMTKAIVAEITHDHE